MKMCRLLYVVVLLYVTACLKGVTAGIQTEYVQVGEDVGGQYKYYSEPKTWEEAKSHCQSEGTALYYTWFNVKDVTKDLIQMFYGDNAVETSNTTQTDAWIWFGLYSKEKGEISNIYGQTMRSYVSTDLKDIVDGQNCVALRLDGTFTEDISCNHKLPFFCRRYIPFGRRLKIHRL